MADDNHTEIHVQLAELTKDVQQVNQLQNRIDVAIDKLTEVSGNIKSMLAVHEEKIEHQEKIDDVIFSKLKIRASETLSIERELKEQIEETEKRLREDIVGIKTEFRGRISLLEKYKWIIIGAFIAVEFLTVLMVSKKGMLPYFSFFN
jgi:chromosome segregation ATPase